MGGSPLAFEVSSIRKTGSGADRPEARIDVSGPRSSARRRPGRSVCLPVVFVLSIFIFFVASIPSPCAPADPSAGALTSEGSADIAAAGRAAGETPGPGAAPAPHARKTPGPGTTDRAVVVPARIVSLAPNLTEILFAIGAGPQVAGVTDFCDYPPDARELPSVGGFINPNPEAVLALAPDLVVVTPNVGNRPFVERLMRTGARVEVLQARNLDEVFQAVETLGRASGHQSEAATLSAQLHDRLRAVEERLAGSSPVRVLLSIQIEPLLVAGPGSYPADLLRLAGGESIVPDRLGPYPTFSIEQVVASAPDVIVQTRMDTREGMGSNGEETRLVSWWKRWSSIPAVSNGEVHVVDGDTLLRPGPRAIDGIELLVGLLHPALAGGVEGQRK